MRLMERGGHRGHHIPGPGAVDQGPAPAATVGRGSVLVMLCGDLPGADTLAAALPMGWAVGVGDGRTHPATDLVVVVAAVGESGHRDLIAQARAEHPGDVVLAIVAAMAHPSVVVAALEAGADACVRAASASVVASHLVAMHRRREIDAGRRVPGAG